MLLFALLLVQTVPADAGTACKTTDASLPVALAGWSAPGDRLEPDKAVALDTVDGASLKGQPAGTRPGRAAMLEFRIAQAGTYGVALDQRGWIDVLPGATGGAPLKPAAFGHGPECSSIRKIVRFTLAPGSYRLFVTGLASAKAKVMLVTG